VARCPSRTAEGTITAGIHTDTMGGRGRPAVHKVCTVITLWLRAAPAGAANATPRHPPSLTVAG